MFFLECVTLCCLFFFFKQKTAYEMRISDWSSDVCSSDLWGVNVALARNGRVVAGVTSLPMLDEFYVAELGGGAWCNEQRIHVSARGRLVEAVLACGIPFAGKPDHPLFAREMALLTEATAGIRRTGACSVDMA